MPAAAGKPVTRATAMRVASVTAAVKMLAGDIAKMPLVMRETKVVSGRQRTAPAIDEPLYKIFKHCPNRWMTSYQLRFYLVAQLLMNGNCFCQKILNQAGDIIELIPLNAWEMSVHWDFNAPLFSPDGLPVTTIDKKTGRKVPVPCWHYYGGIGEVRKFYQPELWHVAINNFDGIGIEGASMIALGKEAISLLLAAEEYAGRNFANGLGISGFLSFPADSEVDETEAQNIYDRLKKDFTGSQNAAKLAMVPGGATFSKMAWSPKESQLLDTRKWSEQEIARLFGGAPLAVKMDLSEKNSTYASSSAFLDEYFNTSLLPITTAIEQTIDRDLIDPADWGRIYAKHNADIILRGSPSERAETNAKLINSMQMTPNEARVLEDRDTIEGGDVLILAANSAVFDPEEGEFFIPGQKDPVPDASKQSDVEGEAVEEEPDAQGDTDDNDDNEPPQVPIKKKGAKAANRLALLARNAVERVMRKEAKGGIDTKFLVEVLMISPEQADAYIAGRKKLNDTEARAALEALAQGE